MSLLRIRVSLTAETTWCQWALINDGGEPVTGEGPMHELPHHPERVQLVIPATQVLITRAKLPPAARRDSGSLLAYALEDEIAGEPDASHASWIGTSGDEEILAVTSRAGLAHWREALNLAGIQTYEIHAETLLLPRQSGEWSMAWNGNEGFIRTSDLEGGATDCGNDEQPPLSLRFMLQQARASDSDPAAIALYTCTDRAAPDIEAWTRELGVVVRPAGDWDWRKAPSSAGVSLHQQRRRWRLAPGILPLLRPAACILAAAMLIHATASVFDWFRLSNQRQDLIQRMESRFRSVFPDAVAVVDPALQMRRNLAGARHAAGVTDSGDLLPMMEAVAAAFNGPGMGTIQILDYEFGRMTLEVKGLDEAGAQALAARLRLSGLSVDRQSMAAPDTGASVILIVRAL
ncbi:MAG: type II secretion system protein GspL [Gammaproteobacteria bacterium]